MRDTYHEHDPAPISGLILDLISLNQQIAAMERETLELAVRSHELRARVNRVLGKVSDTAQTVELAARKKAPTPIAARKEAAPVAPDAA